MIDTVEIDERIEKCEKILKENPDSQIFAALADSLRKKGELDHAFRVCRQGLRIHPDYGPGHLVMAKVNFDRKLYDWAEKELEEAIRLDGRTRSTDILEIEILIKRGFYSKAKLILDRLKVADPANEYYHELEQRIDSGKAEKKAKLAEAEEFYRTQVQSEKASQFSDTETEIPDRPAGFDEALQIVAEFPGVEAAFLTNSEGLVSESKSKIEIDLEPFGAESAELSRFLDGELGGIEFGGMITLHIETENRALFLISVEGRILTAICRSDINLGSFRLRVQKIIDGLRKE